MNQCIYCLKLYSSKKSLKNHQSGYCEVLKMRETTNKRKADEVVTDSLELFVENIVEDVTRYVQEDTNNFSSLVINKIKDSQFTLREVRGIVERNLDNASEDMVNMSRDIDEKISKLDPDIAFEVKEDIEGIQERDIEFFDGEIAVQEIILLEMKRLRQAMAPEFIVVKTLFDLIQEEVNRQMALPVSKRAQEKK